MFQLITVKLNSVDSDMSSNSDCSVDSDTSSSSDNNSDSETDSSAENCLPSMVSEQLKHDVDWEYLTTKSLTLTTLLQVLAGTLIMSFTTVTPVSADSALKET